MTSPCMAQKQNPLQEKIQPLLEQFHGKAGLYILNLKTGEEFTYQADSIFSTASIVKIPIMLGIFDKIEKGDLQFHQPLIYRDSIRYGGSGLMQHYQDSVQTDLRTLLALMLSYSDNTTSLWNQSLAGGGSTINELLNTLGYQHTRVNSRTPGREKDWERFGWGQTTPREMASILTKIYRKELVSESASEMMYRLLSNTFYNDYAASQIPPGINVASKQGMVNASRSEVMLVNGHHGDYVFALFTDENEDQSWTYQNEAWVLTRKLSSLVWNHFNSEAPYSPPTGTKKYWEGLGY